MNKSGRLVRFAVRYHLGVNDTNLSVIPYVKNIGSEDIDNDLGFAWHVRDVQIAMGEEDNYLSVFDGDRVDVLLSDTENQTYANLSYGAFLLWKEVNDSWEELDLYWNKNLDYKVLVRNVEGQYNAPVTLFINAGPLAVGQEKSTVLGWIDRVASCSQGMSYIAVDVKFVNQSGDEITSIGTGERFTLQLSYTAYTMGSGNYTCNSYVDHLPLVNYEPIVDSYPGGFNHSVLRVTNWNGYSQGKHIEPSKNYNITVVCGGMSGVASVKGWVGGEETDATNLACDFKYADSYETLYVEDLGGKSFTIEQADENDPVVKYYHDDYLGSMSMITNASGNLIYKGDYKPFGDDIGGSGISTFKFTGQEKDDSGLYRFGVRYYDPNIGRFTQTDPVFNPMMSTYSYANNNPMKYVDKDGRDPIAIYKSWKKNPGEQDVVFIAINEFMARIETEDTVKFEIKPHLNDAAAELFSRTEGAIDYSIFAHGIPAITPYSDKNFDMGYPNNNYFQILQYKIPLVDFSTKTLTRFGEAYIMHEMAGHYRYFVDNPEKYNRWMELKNKVRNKQEEFEYRSIILKMEEFAYKEQKDHLGSARGEEELKEIASEKLTQYEDDKNKAEKESNNE
ncbi:MAG: RHS repeat-associated core domain-containing protein [Nanoarchaeota archaeon]